MIPDRKIRWVTVECPDCEGTGEVWNKKTKDYDVCPECEGRGRWQVPE